MRKYAARPNLAKALFEYIFHHENDVRNVSELQNYIPIGILFHGFLVIQLTGHRKSDFHFVYGVFSDWSFIQKPF